MSAKPMFLALATLVLAGACDRAPTAPDAILPAMNAKGSVILPVKMRADLFWIVDQSKAALEACAPRPGLAVGSGVGEASVIGRFDVVTMDHCSVDLAVVPPVLDGAGEFAFGTPDGSTLHGTYEFFFSPVELGGFFTFHINGGKGRFAGAAGRLDMVPDVALVECADLLCLKGATWKAEFTGWIEIPVPEP